MAIYHQPSCKNDSQILNTNMETISQELSSLLIGGELDSVGAIGLTATTKSPEVIGLPMPYVESCVAHLSNNCLKDDKSCGNVTGAVEKSRTMNTREAHMFQLYRQYYYHHQLQNQQMHQNKRNNQQHFHIASNLYGSAATSHSDAIAQFHSAIAPGTTGLNDGVNCNYSSVPILSKEISQIRSSNDTNLTCGVSSKASTAPKFEFHFLRHQNSNALHPDTNAVPLISSASFNSGETDFYRSGSRNNNGTVNKVNGVSQRRFSKYNDTLKEQEIDYDKIVVDLSTLGLPLDNKEPNPVLRLFGLLRKMHYYLNDVLPLNAFDADIQLQAGKMQTDAQTKCSMPCTMNVQYQVKQAAKKCTIFLCEMQRILNAHKVYNMELELHMECEQSLNKLRNFLTQFETFKRIEMEHKRGQFVTEQARTQTQLLEKLILQLNDQIREAHIYVHAFNWAVERTNRSTIYNTGLKHEIVTPNNNDGSVFGEAVVATAFTGRGVVGFTHAMSATNGDIDQQTTTVNETYFNADAGAVINIFNDTDRRHIGAGQK
ncbi:protein bag-of-marbles [Bactrocera dorsalis]|uniref:Protein bag-of-marbles n=1 Tax=Bactrocera dorsalis TaxID=27457 RepID=A0A9B2GVA7_BACDO|nr:protein bag-of-marbles [Bactrocera dorsalis]